MIQSIGTYSASMVNGILYLNVWNCGKIATTVKATGYFPNCDNCEILVHILFELFYSEKLQNFVSTWPSKCNLYALKIIGKKNWKPNFSVECDAAFELNS